MGHRFAVLALPALLATLVLLVAGCGADQAPDRGAAGPATTAGGGPDPTTAPSTTRAAPAQATRQAPDGVVPASRREPAPDLAVTAFDGRTVTMGEFRGQPAVVNFFESWWLQCRAEQPGLGQVAREFDGEVGFVGVSFRDTVGAGRAHQREFDVPYPLANDASGRTWGAWRVPYQPVTVVVDGQGRIARRFDGEVDPGELTEVLEYLVGS